MPVQPLTIAFADAPPTDPACVVPGPAGQDPWDDGGLALDDRALADLLRRTRTVAMVGASPNWVRPSYFVLKYLQRKGYRVIPVNPMTAGQEILGAPVVASLSDIRERVDVVDVFRRPDAVPDIAEQAIAIGAPALWLQLGIRSPEAAARARAAGLVVVQDRCMKIEHGRLSGELSWGGVNSGIVSSRRRHLLG